VVFRPFVDAAEQASEALTHAMEFLPEEVSWPISFLEVRIRPDASAVGQTIKDIPLRSIPGVSIMAVSRAGQIHNDPDPHFHIYPGDRLIIMGPAHGLKEAETMLNTAIACRESEGTDRFEITEIKIADDSRLSGKTLTELRFRQIHGVTVVGIQRGEQQITAVTPAEKIAGGDSLIVIGMAERVRNLRKAEPL
jgi:K+/H+ antiporter YhaU regulatory subunit KhtT